MEQKKVDFDIKQLIEDIDVEFQKELKKADETLEERVLHHIQEFEKDVKLFVEANKDAIIESLKTKATINITTSDDNLSYELQHLDHPKTVDVLKSLTHSKKAMLVGPTGTGKTTMIEKIAKALEVPFFKYSCSRDSSVHDLLGYKQPRSEEYLNTTFLTAYENGGIFLVDEYDAMSGDMALFFNGVCDNSKTLGVPHRDSKPVAERHKDFIIIMSGNTYGNGSVEYSGRDFQDNALMDRFRMCRHYVGYNPELEKMFMGDNYDWSLKLRKALESKGSYLSSRNMEEMAVLFRTGSSKAEVVKMLTSDLEQEDIRSIMNTVLGKEAPKKKEFRKVNLSTEPQTLRGVSTGLSRGMIGQF